MHAFTDPYLNVKLHTCLCQQLNYTIKNGACLWKCVVSLFGTDNKCKSAYGYHLSNRKEEKVLCKRKLWQVLQPSLCGLWVWSSLSVESVWRLFVVLYIILQIAGTVAQHCKSPVVYTDIHTFMKEVNSNVIVSNKDVSPIGWQTWVGRISNAGSLWVLIV